MILVEGWVSSMTELHNDNSDIGTIRPEKQPLLSKQVLNIIFMSFLNLTSD